MVPLCIMTAVLIFVAGGFCFALTVPRRRLAVGALLGIASILLCTILIAPLLPATSRAWKRPAILEVRSVLADANHAPTSHTDRYGGSYHIIPVSNNLWIVYSEGPDHRDDSGKKQIADTIRVFESAFSQVCPRPLSLCQAWVRRAALWEGVRVWHSFDGDIVWTVSENQIERQGSLQAPTTQR